MTSKDRIQSWMKHHPELRANKYQLAANILFSQMPKEHQTDEVRELLQIIAVGYPIPMETIFREYRAAFQENPIWKDDEFYKRQTKAEEWRKEFINRTYGTQTELFS